MKKLVVLMLATAVSMTSIGNAQDFVVPNGAIIGDGTEYMSYNSDPFSQSGSGYSEARRSPYLVPGVALLAVAAVAVVAATQGSGHSKHNHGHAHSH